MPQAPLPPAGKRLVVTLIDRLSETPLDLLKPLIAILAIVNPIGAIPFFLAFTTGFNRPQRLRTIHVAAFSSACVVAISALAGLRIIEFFGISIASFQVGGGLLLMLSAVQMMHAEPADTRKEDLKEGSDKVDAGDSIAVVPLTIPLLTGPATISTMVILSQRSREWWYQGTLVIYGIVVGLAVYAVFRASGRIARALGGTGINVMTRLMGLILAAMAVEIMAEGMSQLFPVLQSARHA